MTDKKSESGTENREVAYYSNSMQLEFTLYDFKLKFGESMPGGHLNIINIMLSPQHAKVVQMVLDKNIALYEEKFSEIQIPEDVKKRIMEEKAKEIKLGDK